MCDRSHRYTVGHEEEDEGACYSGPDRDKAISMLVTLRAGGEVGQVTAEHVTGGDAGYCSEESCRAENDAIRAWAGQPGREHARQ